MYFGGNKRQISEYEKSLSSLFILSRVFNEYSSSFGKFCGIISCCEHIYGRHCIQKGTTITSTHNLPFLLSRINKLDRDFLYWQTLSLVCPLRKSCDFAFIPSALKRVQRWRVSWMRSSGYHDIAQDIRSKFVSTKQSQLPQCISTKHRPSAAFKWPIQGSNLDCYKRIEKFFTLWFITEHVWLWATVSSSLVSSSPNMPLWTVSKLRNGGEIEQRVEWLLICHGRTRRQVICGAYVSSERWKGENDHHPTSPCNCPVI